MEIIIHDKRTQTKLLQRNSVNFKSFSALSIKKKKKKEFNAEVPQVQV